MFFRDKQSGPRSYLQIVENRWEKGGSRQHVVATLGRLDQLQESGQLEGLLRSGARFAQSVMVLGAHERGELTEVSTHRVGPGLIFERLWTWRKKCSKRRCATRRRTDDESVARLVRRKRYATCTPEALCGLYAGSVMRRVRRRRCPT